MAKKNFVSNVASKCAKRSYQYAVRSTYGVYNNITGRKKKR